MKAKRNPELSRENSEEAPKVSNHLEENYLENKTISDDTKCFKIGLGDGPQVLGSTPPASPPVTGRPTTAARQVITNTCQAFKSSLNLISKVYSTGKRKTIIITTKDRSFEVGQASFSTTCCTKSQVL